MLPPYLPFFTFFWIVLLSIYYVISALSNELLQRGIEEVTFK